MYFPKFSIVKLTIVRQKFLYVENELSTSIEMIGA